MFTNTHVYYIFIYEYINYKCIYNNVLQIIRFFYKYKMISGYTTFYVNYVKFSITK